MTNTPRRRASKLPPPTRRAPNRRLRGYLGAQAAPTTGSGWTPRPAQGGLCWAGPGPPQSPEIRTEPKPLPGVPLCHLLLLAKHENNNPPRWGEGQENSSHPLSGVASRIKTAIMPALQKTSGHQGRLQRRETPQLKAGRGSGRASPRARKEGVGSDCGPSSLEWGHGPSWCQRRRQASTSRTGAPVPSPASQGGEGTGSAPFSVALRAGLGDSTPETQSQPLASQ